MDHGGLCLAARDGKSRSNEPPPSLRGALGCARPLPALSSRTLVIQKLSKAFLSKIFLYTHQTIEAAVT